MSQPATPGPATCADLLSLAAHELRTPTSVISGYLRMLRDATPEHEAALRRMIAEAERSCGRVATLAEELSTIAALETGGLPLATDTFDAFAVAAEAVATVLERQARPVPIVCLGEGSGAPITADRGRIRASLEAAIAAVTRPQPDGAPVAVHCSCQSSPSGPEAVIVIAPEADVERARQAPVGALDERRSGLGLTLPLARRVIEQHQGRIGCPEASGTAAQSILIALPLRA